MQGVVIDDSVLLHDNNSGGDQVLLEGTGYYKAQVDAIMVGTEVWSAVAANNNITGTMGAKLNTASSGGVDYQALAEAVRTELTPELTKIMLLENGLTPTQATVLQEIYALYGLDFTKPLIVTQNSRQAGLDIVQNIVTNSTQTIITRV